MKRLLALDSTMCLFRRSKSSADSLHIRRLRLPGRESSTSRRSAESRVETRRAAGMPLPVTSATTIPRRELLSWSEP